ncbi:GNAT family N-acetyltransferase [Herbaspirillum lusitanum]|jgi:GNAT superfamily N-acetyltransferase|uniref:GNAT family N-acetyltransferase n=1 Tax=Herbaspirillum lusitanum TaxID=213312 RepID=A0ABW9A9A9_9BURK
MNAASVSAQLPGDAQVGEVTIRRARVSDAPAISGVRIDSWRATYRGVFPDAYLDGMKGDQSVQLWQRVLGASSDAACTYVAVVEDEVVGFASGMTLAESRFGCDAELTGMYLLPHIQRRGVGRKLLAHVAASLINAGATGLLTWVVSKNQGARDFFGALGAEELIEQSFQWDDDTEVAETAYGWRKLKG